MILRWHNWEPVAAERFMDPARGKPGVPWTAVLYRHRRTGRHETRLLNGNWTLEQLRRDH